MNSNKIYRIGPFTVVCKIYNGFCFGVRTEPIVEVTESEEVENDLDFNEKVAWVIMIPLIEIYITT